MAARLAPRPDPEPLGAPESPGGSVLARLGSARAIIARAAESSSAALSTDQLGAAVAELAALESQAVALRLALSHDADRRRAAEADADTGTDAWLARLTGNPREVMSGGLWLARMLAEKYHHTRAALAAGAIQQNQAWVIVRAGERCPSWVTSQQLGDAEEALVALATGQGTRSGRPLHAGRLRQAARRMLDTVSRAAADADENARLEAEEHQAEGRSWLTLHDLGDGTWKGAFEIPERHGLLLRTFLERLSAPRRMSRDGAGATVIDDTVPGLTLSWAEKMGSAFTEALEHLPSSWHGPNAFTLMVHLDHAALTGELRRAGHVDTGAALSAAATRHLACAAGILPVVLDGATQPLDLGRARRLHSSPQRHALSVIHEGCAVAGCERPFGWCEIHHPDPWSRGGRTDLRNAVPLCGYHHRRAHDGRWDLRRHTGHEYRFHRRD